MIKNNNEEYNNKIKLKNPKIDDIKKSSLILIILIKKIYY